MRNSYPIFKRELRVYFNSPIAYVVMGIFLFLAGYFFFYYLLAYSQVSFQAATDPNLAGMLSISEGITRQLFGTMVIVLLFMVPALTMRLFAEEKKSGTIELLMTFPVKDTEVVLGKFLASLFVVAVMLAPTVTYIAFLEWVSDVEWGPIFTGYLGVILSAAAFMSLGILFSSLTENQIIAAVLSFGALLLFWVLAWAADMAGPRWSPMLSYLSLINHVENFSKGVLDLRDIVFYLSFIFYSLFLTLRSLDSWKWRA